MHSNASARSGLPLSLRAPAGGEAIQQTTKPLPGAGLLRRFAARNDEGAAAAAVIAGRSSSLRAPAGGEAIQRTTKPPPSHGLLLRFAARNDEGAVAGVIAGKSLSLRAPAGGEAIQRTIKPLPAMTRGRLPPSLRVVLVSASPRRGRSNPANRQAAARSWIASPLRGSQ
jgi:hypothetical protein